MFSNIATIFARFRLESLSLANADDVYLDKYYPTYLFASLHGCLSEVARALCHNTLMHIELNAKHIDKLSDFYTKYVGLEVLNSSAKYVNLGFENTEIICLHHTPDLPTFNPQHAGLYHLAIVFASRSALANVVKQILQDHPELYVGTADHLVSEAFYFNDPEGNGVELYFDKDPDTWQWRDGQIVMGAEYIDPRNYIEQHAKETKDLERHLGHIHLQVGNIMEAQEFYVDILGLVTTFEMPTALFISDGKYHHHLGLNIWHSAGAGKRIPSLGLRQFSIDVKNTNDLEKIKERLTANSIQFEEKEGAIRTEDPWGNVVTIQLA